MKCPYCAEGIKDEAIVCRYCGRDLSVIRLLGPMLERISALEQQVSQIAAAQNTRQLGRQLTETELASEGRTDKPIEGQVTTSQGRRIAWLAAILSVGIVSPLFPLVGFLGGGELTLAITAGIGCLIAMAGGFWAGLNWPGRHLSTYIFSSIAVGTLALLVAPIVDVVAVISTEGLTGNELLVAVPSLVAFFGLILAVGFIFAEHYFEELNRSGTRPRGYTPLRFFLVILGLISLVVYSFLPLLFVSGALFGDLYENRNWWHSDSVSQSATETIYQRTAAEFSKPQKRPRQTTVVVIQALLAPATAAIVWLIGTIIQVSSSLSMQ